MVGMFVETGDLFRCQPPAKGEDEIVVSQLSFNFTVRDGDYSVKRIDAGDFCFDEVNFSIQQRLAQVERNIRSLTLTKSEPDECWIEYKVAAARDERNLVLFTELFSESLGSHNASESATEDQNFRHHVVPSSKLWGRLCMICTTCIYRVFCECFLEGCGVFRRSTENSRKVKDCGSLKDLETRRAR